MNYIEGIDVMKIIVTGSSGYVASHLIPVLKSAGLVVIGVDKAPSKNTDIVINISSQDFVKKFSLNEDYSIVHLAAARFDHAVSADKYYEDNFISTKLFLENIANIKLISFIHIGSVASIDGSRIVFNNELNCDDAYRSTKFLQSSLIDSWCSSNSVRHIELYPSAIYDDEPRDDTNIGKLQKIIKYLPIIPRIDSKKSLTFLPKFVRFILFLVTNPKISGHHITFEKPVKTVTETICSLTGKSPIIIFVPFLREILLGLSYVFLVFSKVLKKDLKLLPNRVDKLFCDTDYGDSKIERKKYQDFK